MGEVCLKGVSNFANGYMGEVCLKEVANFVNGYMGEVCLKGLLILSMDSLLKEGVAKFVNG